MNGADKSDQYSTNYKYMYKNSESYFIIWNFLIEMALVSHTTAYLVAAGKKISAPNNRHAVIQGMITTVDHHIRKELIPSDHLPVVRLRDQHFIKPHEDKK
jgi:hypothetical protein